MARIPRTDNKDFGFPAWGDGSAGPASGGGAAAPGGSAPQSGGASPTGWVNVQNYLDANRTQADAMGTNLAGKIDKEAAAAVPAADKYRADANAYANAPKSTLNPDFKAWMDNYTLNFNANGQDPKRMAEWYKKFGTTPPPQAVTATPGTAPGMPSAPGKALEKIQAATTPAGRAEMFAQSAGPSYNAGQSNLDSYLAGAGGGGQALQELGKKYGTVLDLVRYPYPGVQTPGNRPGSPNDAYQEPGTVPLPADKQPGGPAYGNGGISGVPGQRPGGTVAQPVTTKRKRFA